MALTSVVLGKAGDGEVPPGRRHGARCGGPLRGGAVGQSSLSLRADRRWGWLSHRGGSSLLRRAARPAGLGRAVKYRQVEPQPPGWPSELGQVISLSFIWLVSEITEGENVCKHLARCPTYKHSVSGSQVYQQHHHHRRVCFGWETVGVGRELPGVNTAS